MPIRGDKHGERAERVFYPDFLGGLDFAAPVESIARNELREAVNVAFSPLTGSMRVRGGLVWSGRLPFEAGGGAAVPGRGFLLREKGTRRAFRFRWGGIGTTRGTFSGDGPISAAAWGDEALLVASGGRLQKFEPHGYSGLPKLSDIGGAPAECRAVFVRDGRAGVVTRNDDDGHFDTLRFSAVGDCESWDNDPNDDSTGQFLEVGYKDGMDIDAVIPLSRDLIIFKSPEGEPDKGIVWRLAGSYPDWQLLEVAHNTGTFGPESVRTVGSDVYYLTTAGLASLSGVTAYGEVRTAWPDRKVANALAQRMTPNARLWNAAAKEQLWILPGRDAEELEGKIVWVFDYGRGIWTQFEFPLVPSFAASIENMLFVTIGKGVYQVHDGYIRDELYPEVEPPAPIRAKMRLGVVLRGLQTLIKAAFASFVSTPSTTAGLKLKGFTMPMWSAGINLCAAGPLCAATDATKADWPLFPNNGVATARQRCIVRGWAVTPEIEINGGGFSMNTLGLEAAEV